VVGAAAAVGTGADVAAGTGADVAAGADVGSEPQAAKMAVRPKITAITKMQ